MKGLARSIAVAAAAWAAFCGAAGAQTVTASRTIVAGEIIAPRDIVVEDGAEAIAEGLIGKQARRSLYKGQPVADGFVRTPVLVKRNAIVEMLYRRGALVIRTEGRALDEGGDRELIRVMNLNSRQTVTARIVGSDRVEVGS